MRIHRFVGVLALAAAMVFLGPVIYGCDHDCAGKSADCAAGSRDCSSHAAKKGGTESASMAAGQPCPMKAEECTAAMRKDAETHGWLGVSVNINDQGQVSITKVWADSPAEKAGLKAGDRLTALNGIQVDGQSTEKALSTMMDAKIGDKVSLEILRGSAPIQVSATLGKMPEDVLAESIQKHLREHHTLAQN